MGPTSRPCVAAVVVAAVAVAAAVKTPLRVCRFGAVVRPLFSYPCLLIFSLTGSLRRRVGRGGGCGVVDGCCHPQLPPRYQGVAGAAHPLPAPAGGIARQAPVSRPFLTCFWAPLAMLAV